MRQKNITHSTNTEKKSPEFREVLSRMFTALVITIMIAMLIKVTSAGQSYGQYYAIRASNEYYGTTDNQPPESPEPPSEGNNPPTDADIPPPGPFETGDSPKTGDNSNPKMLLACMVFGIYFLRPVIFKQKRG